MGSTSSQRDGARGAAWSRGPGAYFAATLVAAVVILMRWSLSPVLGDQAPFLVLLIAPVLIAARAGFGPGLFATAVCALVGEMLFIAPHGSPWPPNLAEWVRVGVFCLEGALFSWLSDERIRAIAAAQHGSRQFRDAIEAAPSGMILVAADGRVTYANARAREWFGYPADEFVGLSIEVLVPPALRATHRQDRAGFGAAPQPRTMGEGRELRARRKDGSEFPVEIGLSPVPTVDAPLVLAAVVDVTEPQRARERLVESERRQRFMLELTERLQSLRDPAQMMDAATRALGEYLGVAQVGYGEIDAAQQHVVVERDWNDGRIASVVGTWRMDDFGPKFVLDMKAGRSVAIPDISADPRTSAPEVQRAYESIATRAILDTPLIRDGRMVSMIFVHHPEVRPWSTGDILLAEETCARIWAAVERVRAERSARVSLELLDRAGAAARVGAFIDTLDGPHAMRWSGRMFEIMGLPQGDTPTRERAFDRYPPAARTILHEAMKRTMRDGEPLEIELPLLPQADSASWVRIYAVPTMRDGRCVEISGAVQDISDRKQLELDVVAATNQERARIGEDLHDDLGQVLTAVTLEVGAYRRRLGSMTDVPAQVGNIAEIERHLEYARTVCRRLARNYVAPVSSTSFLPMLRQLARDAADGRDCVVRGSDLPASIPPRVAQELFRIAQEALTNALKHSAARRIVIETRVDAERVTLAIEDDGVGLAGNDAGSGVGLTSMRSRAARIGGIITLGPGARGGTQVVVTCARADAVAATA